MIQLFKLCEQFIMSVMGIMTYSISLKRCQMSINQNHKKIS